MLLPPICWQLEGAWAMYTWHPSITEAKSESKWPRQGLNRPNISAYEMLCRIDFYLLRLGYARDFMPRSSFRC